MQSMNTSPQLYSRRTVTVYDFWFEMEKIGFSYILYVNIYFKKIHHSVVLTNTVVFPHVESPLVES